jgi:hypothetical protein
MDYRALLVKYIRYVGHCEGTDYLDDCAQVHSADDAGITSDEFAELERLSREARRDDAPEDEELLPRCTFCGRTFATEVEHAEHYAEAQRRHTHNF